MSRRQAAFFVAVLIVLSAGWGLTMPLTKIAVSTGYQHFGLMFWQMSIGFAVMSVLGLMMGKRLPLGREALRIYVTIAAIGSLLPNTISYQAAVHLPAGVMSILLSTIPMFAFPIALALSLDRFEWRRFFGLGVGLLGVLILVVPEADVSGGIPIFWALIYLLSGMCYAFEGNYVAKWGTAGLDPLQVLWGASLVGGVIMLPVALMSGQWISPLRPYGAPEIAQILSSAVHVVVYAGYVWLVPRAGPVFSVQISYFVTLTGIFWAWLLLQESYATTVWMALALLMVGMFLVQPRRAPAVVERPGAMGDTAKKERGGVEN